MAKNSNGTEPVVKHLDEDFYINIEPRGTHFSSVTINVWLFYYLKNMLMLYMFINFILCYHSDVVLLLYLFYF